MLVRVVEVKIGNFIKLLKDTVNNIYYVTNIEYSMKGRGSSSYDLHLNVVSGHDIGKNNIRKRFSVSDKVDILFTEEKSYEYLYTHDDLAVFMCSNPIDQIELNISAIGDKVIFLESGMFVNILFCDSMPLSVKFPTKLTVIIEETEPSLKGQTISASPKTAFIKNGIKIMVPQFIKTGDKIIILTDDLTYISRA